MEELVLYTLPTCPQCTQTKELLKNEGLKYREEDLRSEKDFVEKQLGKEIFRAPILTVQKDGKIIISMEGLSKNDFVQVVEEFNSVWE